MTPVNTYQDQGLSTVNPNPITLDSTGSCVAWSPDSTIYRQIVKDSQGNQIWDAVTGIGGFTNPMTAQGDLIIGGTAGAASKLPIGANRQVPISNGSTLAYGSLTASDVGADPAGAASGLTGIGGQATLVLQGYAIATNVGVITVSASAPTGTPVNGQLWFQHA